MYINNRFRQIIITTALALSLSVPSCIAETDIKNNNIIPKTQTEKKSELYNVLKKFAKSMTFVISSGFVIWGTLLVYKKVTKGKSKEIDKHSLENDLNSPETINDAVKFVIEKF